MARVGKIARLPHTIKEELNKRLRDGAAGPNLLPWLNGQMEVRAVLEEHFGNKDINAQNLSDWRNGGYEDWLKHNDSLHQTKELAQKCFDIAKAAGGNISEGMAAMLGGELMTIVEDVSGEADPVKKLILIDGASKLIERFRTGDHSARALEIKDAQLKQKDRSLEQKDLELQQAERAFQWKTADLILQSATDESVQRIASQPISNEARIEAIGAHIFGDLWKPRT